MNDDEIIRKTAMASKHTPTIRKIQLKYLGLIIRKVDHTILTGHI